jgi:hypothetical protein
LIANKKRIRRQPIEVCAENERRKQKEEREKHLHWLKGMQNDKE